MTIRFTDELQTAARPIWERQLEHPFVKGISDGSLDEERFKCWVFQDYLYLREFARVLGWAVTKAEHLDSMAWYAAMLSMILTGEMDLHREYAAGLGFTPTALERFEMRPATRAYAGFVVSTAAGGDITDAVVALLSRIWGRHFLGTRLREASPSNGTAFADWIAHYTSDEFGEFAAWLRGEMDRLSEGLPPEKKNKLIETFVLASEYGRRFWEMCWSGEALPA